MTYALRHNVVLIAPAGDNAAGTDAANYPAAYPGVISVGGFGENFALAPYSSRQPYVTLTAPGQDVIAADAAGSYEPVSSTTAASAIASGVAALIRSRFPGLSAAQVRHAMTSSTVFRSIPGRKHGGGLGTVNAERALAVAAAAAAPASERAGVWLAAADQASQPARPDRAVRRPEAAGAAGRSLRGRRAGDPAAAHRRLRGAARPPAVRPGQRAGRGLEPNPQPAYSPYGSGDPDRGGMMEFFAARHPPPRPRRRGRSPSSSRPTSRPGRPRSAQVPAAGVLGAGVTGRATDIESAPGCRSGRAHAVTAGPRQYPVTRPGSPRPSPIANCPGPCPPGPRRAAPGPRSRLVRRPPA